MHRLDSPEDFKIPGENVLILCTDYAGYGMDAPGITVVVLSPYVNRIVRFVPRKIMSSISDAVNEAGRAGRHCAGNVWHIGRFLTSPLICPAESSFPTHKDITSSAQVRELTVVWGTNSRIDFAKETCRHLNSRGFADIQFVCGADKEEADSEDLWNKLCMINCLFVLLPLCLETSAEVFLHI